LPCRKLAPIPPIAEVRGCHRGGSITYLVVPPASKTIKMRECVYLLTVTLVNSMRI
jgi:hypothetical protein